MDDEASHLRNITLLKNEMLKTGNQRDYVNCGKGLSRNVEKIF